MVLSFFRRGRRAERQAARHLVRAGFLILARNVRRAGGEIDLLALEQGVLVVVEVRQRKSGNLAADLSIDRAKEQRLEACLRAFLRERRGQGLLPVRYDAVLIDGAGQLTHRRGSLNRERSE